MSSSSACRRSCAAGGSPSDIGRCWPAFRNWACRSSRTGPQQLAELLRAPAHGVRPAGGHAGYAGRGRRHTARHHERPPRAGLFRRAVDLSAPARTAATARPSARARLVESEQAQDRTIVLPLFPQMSDEQQDRVVDALRASLPLRFVNLRTPAGPGPGARRTTHPRRSPVHGEKRKIMITGGAGFIGSHLAHMAVARGFTVGGGRQPRQRQRRLPRRPAGRRVPALRGRRPRHRRRA